MSFPDQFPRVCLAQVIYALTPKNGRLCASGLGVVRDLLGSTIASECDSHAPARRCPREGNGRSGAHPRPLRTLGSRRHQNLHYSKAQQHVCHGCRKTFSRLDALNVSAWSIAVHLSQCANLIDTDSPLFDPCSSISAFGRFRTIPSDTVSLWISDLRSEALIGFFCALFSPSRL